MLMSLSILPITLLLVYGVICVDLHKSKRVPRRQTAVKRTINANHLPAWANYDFILVPHEDKETNTSKMDLVIRQYNKASVNRKSLKAGPRSVQLASPVENSETVRDTVYHDYEEEILMKLKGRSKNVTDKRKVDTKNHPIPSIDEETNTEHKTLRRRSQQVRKLEVNKRELQRYIKEAENSEKKSDTVGRAGDHNVPKRRKQLREAVVPIVESENYVFAHSGDFHYSYKGGDGTQASERGELKSSNGGAGSAVEGSFSYTDKDGNDFSVTYTADENGYRPVGAHLPTPPPIPLAIQRALALLATKTTPEPITEKIL